MKLKEHLAKQHSLLLNDSCRPSLYLQTIISLETRNPTTRQHHQGYYPQSFSLYRFVRFLGYYKALRLVYPTMASAQPISHSMSQYEPKSDQALNNFKTHIS